MEREFFREEKCAERVRLLAELDSEEYMYKAALSAIQYMPNESKIYTRRTAAVHKKNIDRIKEKLKKI